MGVCGSLTTISPWSDAQGHSGFVWGAIGAIGRLRRCRSSSPALGPKTIITAAMLAGKIVCGPDVGRHAAALQAYADAGFDELYVNQIGPDQDAFFTAYAEQVLPRLR